MSLKDYFRAACPPKTDKTDDATASASSWGWLIDGAKESSRPKTDPKPRFGTGGDDHSLLPWARAEREAQRRAQSQAELRAAESRKQVELKAAESKRQAGAALTKNSDLVDRFLEIAERKVSILDDYGDENWEALPVEVYKCLLKIAKRNPLIDVSRIGVKSLLTPGLKKLLGGYNEPTARYMAASLESRFRAYHDARKKSPSAAHDIGALSGTDFETYLAKLLKQAGFESVVGTPASGDQGADLIARRSGKTIAIQAKGYRGSVGNGAVQEIVGAIRFYRADEGWVITNSTFTASARALAQANNIRLIDGSDLKDPATLGAGMFDLRPHLLHQSGVY
jgi:hypothetical protein